MPLVAGKSKASREKNIATEIAAGKDPKQAVAIGYAEQRRAQHHKAADMDLSAKKKYGDAQMEHPMKKHVPALAIEFGHADPEDGEDGADVDNKGADDEEEALQKAGDAAVEALRANDGLSFAKAIQAIHMASGGGDEEAADMDIGDNDEPENPFGTS